MVKVRVNRLNHFGCLVIGVSFKSSCYQWPLTWSQLHGLHVPVWIYPLQVQWHSQGWEWETCHQLEGHHYLPEARSYQNQMWVMLMLNMLWMLLVFHHHREGSGPLEGWGQKGNHLCPFLLWPHVCDTFWIIRGKTTHSRLSAMLSVPPTA